MSEAHHVPFIARVVAHLSQRIANTGQAWARRLAHRPTPEARQDRLLRALLNAPQPVVLDIGANVGHFSREVFERRPDARILAIDPIPANVELLKKQFESHPGSIAVHGALGPEPRESVTFHVHPYSQASSLLEMSDKARETFRSLDRPTTDISVPMYTVDQLVSQYLANESITLMKIDVEGFETRVLDGASQTLQKVGAVLVEAQAQALNEGVELFDRVCEQARRGGLRLERIYSETPDLFGDLLWFDLVFVREGTERLKL